MERRKAGKYQDLVPRKTRVGAHTVKVAGDLTHHLIQPPPCTAEDTKIQRDTGRAEAATPAHGLCFSLFPGGSEGRWQGMIQKL